MLYYITLHYSKIEAFSLVFSDIGFKPHFILALRSESVSLSYSSTFPVCLLWSSVALSLSLKLFHVWNMKVKSKLIGLGADRRGRCCVTVLTDCRHTKAISSTL